MAAMYLDPRFKSELNENETVTATATIQNLYVQIKWKPSPSPAGLNSIDRQIEALVLGNQRSQESEAQIRSELALSMANYHHIRSTDINRDAISFWKENKQNFPQLYEVAKVIFSIASSISETERRFSAFSYIYNVRRMSLSPKNVSNILMIRLNKDLFYNLKQLKINKIKSRK